MSKEETKKELELLVRKHIQDGTLSKLDGDDQFSLTPKGIELYDIYLNKFTEAIKICGVHEGFNNIPINELKKTVQEGLLKVYQNNIPLIFIHVLGKANEIGYETYIKFELKDPSTSEVFH